MHSRWSGRELGFRWRTRRQSGLQKPQREWLANGRKTFSSFRRGEQEVKKQKAEILGFRFRSTRIEHLRILNFWIVKMGFLEFGARIQEFWRAKNPENEICRFRTSESSKIEFVGFWAEIQHSDERNRWNSEVKRFKIQESESDSKNSIFWFWRFSFQNDRLIFTWGQSGSKISRTFCNSEEFSSFRTATYRLIPERNKRTHTIYVV